MRPVHLYDEKLLFKQIAEGDEIAFRKIYDAYFDRLAFFSHKILKSDNAAEEVVQDIFMSLWINRTALIKVESPRAYIYTVTRNKSIHYLRGLTRETNLIEMVGQNQQNQISDTDHRLNLQELQAIINEAIAKLSPQKQKVFHLSKYENFSHDEIANELQLSKSTIKNHLSETLQYLRKSLNDRPNSEALLLIILIEWMKDRS